MSTILVTGAGGFLGRTTAIRLVSSGCNVVGVVRPGRAIPQDVLGCTHVEADLEDPKSEEILVGCGQDVEAIVHFAAVLPPSLQSSDATECGHRNLKIDRAVFTACERLKCSLVYASTASIYPTDTTDWKREGMRIETCPPYAQEKLESEEEGLRRIVAFGRHFVGLRITAPYGPNQSARTVVRRFLERAIANEPLEYFGTGIREQDFVYVSDVADAVLCALKRHVTGIFNIGYGKPVTMKELAAAVIRAVPGCSSTVRANGAPDPQEIRYARLDIGAAREQLGWQPRTSLLAGLTDWASTLRVEGQHAHRASL